MTNLSLVTDYFMTYNLCAIDSLLTLHVLDDSCVMVGLTPRPCYSCSRIMYVPIFIFHERLYVI